MTSNGRHDPVVDLFASAADDAPPAGEDGDAYDAMLEMDRLEELLEALDDLGVATRDDVEALPAGPVSVEVLAEMRTLGMSSRVEIERRLAELEALLGDE